MDVGVDVDADVEVDVDVDECLLRRLFFLLGTLCMNIKDGDMHKTYNNGDIMHMY